MERKFGSFTGGVDKKAFRQLPKQTLCDPATAQKNRAKRKNPDSIYKPEVLIGQAAPIEGAPSIAELARALKNNVDLIFQFVHDNIEFYPNYGLHKGGWGALVDANGNPFDQCDLMVQLLVEAGYTASYVTGYILLDAAQWSNWLNIDVSDILLAVGILADGGFSGTYNTVTNTISIDYCWVQCSIDGTNYQFDPAMKTYTNIAGTNLATAMSYSQSSFLSNAQSGSTITSNYVQNINETNVHSDLTSYAMNLVDWIQTNNPGATFDEILGGRTIVPVSGPVRNTTLPYQDPSFTPVAYSTLPDSYKATLQLQYDYNTSTGTYNIDQTFYSNDIYGQRMTIWFNESSEAQLYLNGTVVATSSPQTIVASSPLIFTVTHPYATDFADGSSAVDITVGIWYAVGNAWGYASRQLAQIHRLTLQTNIITGGSSDEDVLGESLSTIWFNFIGENSSGADVINRLSSCFNTIHHQCGVIGQYPDNLLVNFFFNIWSTEALTESALPAASSAHLSLLWHTLEAAVINQIANVACASAPSVIEAANLAGTKNYKANYENWISVVKPELSSIGYPAGTLAGIEAYFIAITSIAAIAGAVSSGGGDVLNIFVHDPALPTNPTEVSYTTISGDDTSSIAAALASRITSALSSYGVTAYSSSSTVIIESFTGNATTYTASVTSGSETISLETLNDQYFTVTISDNPNVHIGIYFNGFGYYCLTQNGAEFLGPLNSPVSKGAFSDDTNDSETNDSTSGDSPSVGGAGVPFFTLYASNEPIDLFQGRYLYSNTDISVSNQSDPYQLSLVRSYNSGSPLNNDGLGLGWNHNYQINATANSDGFIAFGYESVSAAAAVIAEMYVCQDILQSTIPSISVADVVTICVANVWLMGQISNNTAIVQFGSEYQIFARLPDGSYVPPLGVKNSTTLTMSTTFTYTTPDKIVYSFNSSGQISTIAYPFGVTISFTYTSGRLTQVSNGFRTLTLAYSGSNLYSVTDGHGRYVYYTIDSNDDLTAFEDPLSYSTTYSYGSPGLLYQIFRPANPTSAVVTNVYDTLGRVKTQTDAYSNTWNYYFAGSRSEEDDPNGNSRVWYFDAFGSALQYTDQLGNTTTYEFDGLERVTLVTLPEGNSTAFTYDANSNVLTVTASPKPGSSLSDITNTFTYDSAWNKVKTATDGNGNSTTYTYDGTSSLLTQIQYPTVGAGTPYAYFSYNSIGQLLTATDPTGIITSFTYDSTSKNLLTQVVDSGSGHLNLTTTFTYDAIGNVATVEDPDGNTTSLTFDANRRLTQRTDPSPFDYVATYSYDDNNNLTQVQNQTATSTEQTYTAAYTIDSLISSITEPPINGGTTPPNPTAFAYDNLRRVRTVTDPVGNIYTYAYDAMSRIYEITYPNSVVSDTRTYTDNGYLETITDALSNETQYAYDGFDRLATTTYADATTEQNTYDPNNNVTQFTTRSTAVIGFTYDAMNQTLTKSPASEATVTYTYDLAGRLTSASTPVVSGDLSTGDFQLFYDTAGRFYKEEYPDSKTVVLGLDSNGNVTSITYPDSTVITRVYDQLNRLTSVSDSLGSCAFTYDPLSRRTEQTYGNELETSFTYDLSNNLLTLTVSNPLIELAYTYNSVHQEIGREINDATYLWEPSTSHTVTYGTVNDVNQYPTAGSNTYSYNNDGCVTGDGTFAYSYDTENRLVSVTGPGLSVSYKYDPLGRQATKTVNSALTRFIYSGLQRIADYNGSDSLIDRYIFGVALDEPLWAESSGGTITYLTADETGSIILTTNSLGAVVSRTAYDPFGNSSSVNATNFGFTGQRFDPETGLYFYKARHYSPNIGRFLQNDPISYAGGDLNLYGYVNNDPLNMFDPMGLSYTGGSEGDGLAGIANQVSTSVSTVLKGFVSIFVQPVNAQNNASLQQLRSSNSSSTPSMQNLSVNPAIQATLDFSRGLAGALDFGITNQIFNVAERQGVDVQSPAYAVGEMIPLAAILLGGLVGYIEGIEFSAGKNFRVAPFGNRTGHPLGELPHYHRRVIDPITGDTIPGQGLGWHRPWETSSKHQSFWDRF